MKDNLKYIIIEKSNKFNINIDIKNDVIFKYIFTSKVGIKYIGYILSELFNIKYNDLINNIELINTESPRSKLDKKSSMCDIVYKYKNNLFIIEMNNTYTDYILHKNHFYMFYKQVMSSYNNNKYGKYYTTYLIDIDNYDILKELNRVNSNDKTKLIYEEKLIMDYKNITIYNNIKNIHVNLDYLKKKRYNYNTLTNIEVNCLIFIETDEKILNKNKKVKEVVNMFKWLILGNERLLFKHMNKGIDEIEEVRKHNLWLGEQRGIERGIKKGTNQEKISIAKSMKKKNFSIKEISELTKLSEKEICKL